MPTYEYRCNACGTIEEIVHSIKDSPTFRCKKCSSSEPLERLISFNRDGFFFRGGTETTAWKEKRHRHKRQAELGVKQVERWGSGPRLQPNVAGMEVDSWSDAAKVAKEAGMNADSYQPHIEKEKGTSKISGVNDATWKAVKENKDKN